MGLGLAIDGSLFMVSRFREEMSNGLAPDKAIDVTMRTAGRTVFFSALTVAAAAASLTVFNLNFLWSMGVAGVLAAVNARPIGHSPHPLRRSPLRALLH